MEKTGKAVNQTIEGEAKVEQKFDQSAVPGLDLQDLALALSLLNAAIKRGAYEPNELAVVGSTYGKLDAFLQYQARLQAAAQEAAKRGEA